jgi:hypothetical protein
MSHFAAVAKLQGLLLDRMAKGLDLSEHIELDGANRIPDIIQGCTLLIKGGSVGLDTALTEAKGVKLSRVTGALALIVGLAFTLALPLALPGAFLAGLRFGLVGISAPMLIGAVACSSSDINYSRLLG